MNAPSKKTLVYRLFGLGKLAETVRTELTSEGIVLWDEGISGSVTFVNFRAPSRYSSWRRRWYTSSIVLTRTRLFGVHFTSPVINVPLADERLRGVQISAETPNTFAFAFDAGLFQPTWSGQITYHFRTQHAEALVAELQIRTKASVF